MPEMDGYEATRRIRLLSNKVSGIPIVAMTANALKGDREKCLAAGMDDYISKPVEPASLRIAIERILRLPSGSKAETQVRASRPPIPSGGKIFDRDDFLARMENDKSLMDEMLPLFLKDMDRRVGELEKAVGKDNKTAIGVAHAIKGAASNAGAGLLHDAAKLLEDALKSESPTSEMAFFLKNVRERFEELKPLFATMGYK